MVFMALYAGGKVILVMAGRVAVLHICLGDLAGRDYRQGMHLMARAADGDLAALVWYINVRIHLLALVRDIDFRELRKFVKGTMTAKAEFGLRLFRQGLSDGFALLGHMTEQTKVDGAIRMISRCRFHPGLYGMAGKALFLSRKGVCEFGCRRRAAKRRVHNGKYRQCQGTA